MAIPLPSPIKVGGRFPIDDKYWVASAANLNDGDIYEGMDRWTLDTGKKYTLQKSGLWELQSKGDAGTIEVGTVTTGPTASVNNVGTSTNAKLNFIFPKPEKGKTPQITIGSVETSSFADVQNVGNEDIAILNFKLPVSSLTQDTDFYTPTNISFFGDDLISIRSALDIIVAKLVQCCSGTNTPNQSPSVTVTANSTSIQAGQSTTLTAIPMDSDGTIVQVVFAEGSTILSDLNTAPWTYTTNTLSVGSHTITVMTKDNGGLTASTQVTITVTAVPVNQAPVANAGSNRNVAYSVGRVVLDGYGTDSDGTIASYKWTQESGPSTLSFSSSTIYNPEVTNLVSGTYVLGLVVTDNKGANSAKSTMNIVVGAIPSDFIRIDNVIVNNKTVTLATTKSNKPSEISIDGINFVPGPDITNVPNGTYNNITARLIGTTIKDVWSNSVTIGTAPAPVFNSILHGNGSQNPDNLEYKGSVTVKARSGINLHFNYPFTNPVGSEDLPAGPMVVTINDTDTIYIDFGGDAINQVCAIEVDGILYYKAGTTSLKFTKSSAITANN